MIKTLSICIPTYNRADKLKEQIESVLLLTDPYVSACAIIISDNYSTDNTPEIVRSFQQKYPERILFFRQKENIGFVNNYTFLIHQAVSDFIWVLGDDDPIYPSVLNIFFKKLNSLKNELTVFHYNHRCITDTGTIIHDAFYSFEKDIYDTGKTVFCQLAANHQVGGLMFISASIFKTPTAKNAIESGLKNSKNLAIPLYISAYAASKGNVYFASQNQLDCVYGPSFWKSQMIHVFIYEVSEIISTFRKLHYSRTFCVNQFILNIRKYIGLKGFLKLCIKRPLYASRIIAFFIKTIL